MVYRVGTPRSEDPKDLLNYMREEFDKIATNFALFDNIILKELHEAPSRIPDGLTVFADGTDWNPGSGRGVYTYYGSSWKKLG